MIAVADNTSSFKLFRYVQNINNFLELVPFEYEMQMQGTKPSETDTLHIKYSNWEHFCSIIVFGFGLAQSEKALRTTRIEWAKAKTLCRLSTKYHEPKWIEAICC